SAMALFATAIPNGSFAQEAIVLDRFMTLSRFATGHKALDTMVGAGLLDGLRAADDGFDAAAIGLEQRIASQAPADVEALDAALQDDPLRDTLLAIIRAWYSGAVASGSQAVVYTFDKALIYQPALDAVPIPTYALNGPDWWTAAPPALSAMPAF
ncbi:MAG: sorbitol dehydrogenase family protein, partial [Paracoccus sp. (in: a-proteobacteria)]|nr:sorbitol dehydrogenase family protein [Paracoccus sp. (in: a-proteobacteria)]